MSAYLIAQVKVGDQAGFRAYERGFFPTLKPFGGRLIVADGAPESIEGEWPDGRTVLIEFPSMDDAKAWYHSDEYQEISAVRWANAESTFAFLRGFERPV
jgi:uncharacterized protein (DUF1330 family)